MREDNHQLATSQDLIDLRAHVDQRFDQLGAEIMEGLMELKSLLHDPAWARPMAVRLRAIFQIDERLALIEERVRDIEYSRLAERGTSRIARAPKRPTC